MEDRFNSGQSLRDLLMRMRNITIKFHPMKNLTMGEYALLKSIDIHNQQCVSMEDGRVKSSDLSDYLGASRPAISRMLNMAEEKGYLSRSYFKKDRRVTYIELTELGKAVLEEEKQEYIRITQTIADQMETEELEHLIHSCNRLFDILENMGIY